MRESEGEKTNQKKGRQSEKCEEGLECCALRTQELLGPAKVVRSQRGGGTQTNPGGSGENKLLYHLALVVVPYHPELLHLVVLCLVAFAVQKTIPCKWCKARNGNKDLLGLTLKGGKIVRAGSILGKFPLSFVRKWGLDGFWASETLNTAVKSSKYSISWVWNADFA